MKLTEPLRICFLDAFSWSLPSLDFRNGSMLGGEEEGNFARTTEIKEK